MKLIIDIPDHVYEWVENTGKLGMYRIDTAKVIQNGIPLDDIKTEILALNDDYCSTQEVLDIIENIGKGDKE